MDFAIPTSWQGWLVLYAIPGALMMVYFLIKAIQERPTEFAKGINKALGKEVTLKQQFQEIGVYCLALTCVLIGWPGFTIWFAIDKAKEKKQKAWEDRPDFDCAPEYLIEPTTPAEVELLHYISDPLGSVPQVPFGHLNAAWKQFLETVLPDEEIWSFHVPKSSPTGKYQWASSSEIFGYARVKNGQIQGEFIYESD